MKLWPVIPLVLLAACTSETEDPKIQRFGRFTVTGESMLPHIHPGDVVEVSPTPFEALRPGDVIVFRHEDRNIVHRIREVRGRKIWTKGDNNALRDNFWVYPKDVIGKVTACRTMSSKETSPQGN